ncbi:hypothetical protein [Rhodocaloribacter sp.]
MNSPPSDHPTSSLPGRARTVRDTHPEAERVQIELFRRAGPEKRLALALSLSASTVEMARNAIRRRHPTLSEEEVKLKFVEVHYGKELADRVRASLRRDDP